MFPPGTSFNFMNIYDGTNFLGDPEYEYSGDDYEPGILKRMFYGILGVPKGFVNGFIIGAMEGGDIAKDCLNLNAEVKDVDIDYKRKYSIYKEQILVVIEELKKFVFFKDNKVVGFIKFGKDITPPVNGYYFNCEYKMKIEVEITGIILKRNKYLKTQIDLYDSDEYIAKMKNIFKN